MALEAAEAIPGGSATVRAMNRPKAHNPTGPPVEAPQFAAYEMTRELSMMNPEKGTKVGPARGSVGLLPEVVRPRVLTDN